MKRDFIEELTWRCMLSQKIDGIEELLKTERVSGYIGFDPTADSLGVGNLVQVMTLLHFQESGHRPIALVGGATGMVGDPSGKSSERNLLSAEDLENNLAGQRKQLERFLDFNAKDGALLVNNYDWFKEMRFLDFIRDAGKHLTVNYMLAKDSVKKRVDGGDNSEGMSFTEFTYQLIQGWDFYWLWKHHGVKLQMGGSDQWGNITAGTELIRRKGSGKAFAITTPLITKADGTKFGKTEKGNLWLDPKRTSGYEFFQFWLNASDEDAATYVRIFTLLDRASVEGLIADHATAPHERKLQKALAKDITTRVHGREQLDVALAATEVLFGKGTIDQLKALTEAQFEQVFIGAGVSVAEVGRDVLRAGIPLNELFSDTTKFLASRGEVQQMLKSNALSLNKDKLSGEPKQLINADKLINGRFLLLQKGKKDYCLLKAV